MIDTLKTNYKDDIFSGSRKYTLVENPDGTISLEDKTDYVQQGDTFAAKDANSICLAIGVKHETEIIVPSTAVWTLLTAENVGTLDPRPKVNPDPSLKYPYFTDIDFDCDEDDEVYPEWDIDTAELGCLGNSIRVSAGKLRIYCNADMSGTQLRAYQYTQKKSNTAS
ncbi:hypothetical protein [Holdemania sp. 1001302B_160321_E10]|uniref:hypothetical protein n=1 Tax=Holdemania sp. 1001302B_160321_E10 TaxID=2787120 RepID=UPI0018987F87|nr:hypothetical protein [Holdemania sp. 1001302B_160321_E10]